MPHPVRLGCIGLGRWGEHLAEAVVRTGCGEISRCFTRTEQVRLRFAAKFGCRPARSVDELLDDPELDGVLIATPHTTHVDLIAAAAAAGKHVFVEKPLSLTVADGERAIAAAHQGGIILQVANHRSRQSGIRRIKQWIDEGELGTVHMLEANFSTNVSVDPKPGWKQDLPERPLGGMTSLGLHILEDFVYLAGAFPTSLTTMSKRLLGRCEIDDMTMMTLDFANGPYGYLGTGMVLTKMEMLGVHGSAGSAWNEAIIAPGDAMLDADRLYRQGIDELERSDVPNEPNDALGEQMAEFANSIRTGTPPTNGGPEALRMVTLLAAGVESHRIGGSVLLADFDPHAGERLDRSQP
jgi:predicted dehydrogenase